RLGARLPRNTEEAQYAIGFPVAAILARGGLGTVELSDAGLCDAEIATMLTRIRLVEDASFSAQFPQHRIAVVRIGLKDGSSFVSEPTEARGEGKRMLSDDELLQKFRRLTGALEPERIARVECSVAALDRDPAALGALIDAILEPV
ncbi:MAG: MmgE/PrpD family protein, partial [Pseudolabrys sp.]|nr:MmgE/PrpD family protein [Pseudolabrys sp.]